MNSQQMNHYNKFYPAFICSIVVFTFCAYCSTYEQDASNDYKNNNYKAAFEKYSLLANQDIAFAQYNLGVMYENGQGVTQDNIVAVQWFRKAAEQGLANAQQALGLMYVNGQGVMLDYTEAVRWFKKAAEQDLADAQFNLGVMYENGQGVTQDDIAAVQWFRKAAGQGLADAEYTLGFMYENGKGITQDYATADRWFRKAADHGFPDAKSYIMLKGLIPAIGYSILVFIVILVIYKIYKRKKLKEIIAKDPKRSNKVHEKQTKILKSRIQKGIRIIISMLIFLIASFSISKILISCITSGLGPSGANMHISGHPRLLLYLGYDCSIVGLIVGVYIFRRVYKYLISI